MAFCENCGTRLNPGDLFCENCGTKIPVSETDVGLGSAENIDVSNAFSLFRERDWRKLWHEASQNGDGEMGIILTRESRLLAQLSGGSVERLHDVVAGYIADRKKHGVAYYYLDLESSSAFYPGDGLSPIVHALKTINDVAGIRYLFILGNENVIDVASWEDRTEDDDVVESDWAFSSLDVSSPWENCSFNMGKALRVGRLPIYEGEDFNDFIGYFDAVLTAEQRLKPDKCYGLSAVVWKDESNDEYKCLSDGGVDLSPDVTYKIINKCFDRDTNFFFFNLHGSGDTEFWYGQSGYNYPEAASPDMFDSLGEPFLLAVEACYGAKYTGGLTGDNSMLLRAMTRRCLSFVGSSRIAYGTACPPGTCADIVVGGFLRSVLKGETVGDAFLSAIGKLFSDGGWLDDTEAKTVAEFGLYGDPSIRVVAKRTTGPDGSENPAETSFDRIRIGMPDVRRPVRIALAGVNERIEEKIDEFVFDKFFGDLGESEISKIRQKVFRLPDLHLNQKVFSRKLENFSQIVKVYFDDFGNIRKIYESK